MTYKTIFELAIHVLALFTTIFLVRLSPTCFMSPPISWTILLCSMLHLSSLPRHTISKPIYYYWIVYVMYVRCLVTDAWCLCSFLIQQCLSIYAVAFIIYIFLPLFVVILLLLLLPLKYFTPSHFLYFFIIENIVFTSVKWMNTSSNNIVRTEHWNISIIILAVSK